jgi:hypothetical protein
MNASIAEAIAATDIVFVAMQRARSWRGERLREAIEQAIDGLVDLGQHDAAQALIDRLDAIDGNPDLEDDNEDCCSAYEDYASHVAPCDLVRVVGVPAHDPDFEPRCSPHVEDQRLWTGPRQQQPEPEPAPTPRTSKYPFRQLYEGKTDKGTPQWAIQVVHETWSFFLEWFDTREAAEKRLADWGPM